jgi:hypothetical protein
VAKRKLTKKQLKAGFGGHRRKELALHSKKSAKVKAKAKKSKAKKTTTKKKKAVAKTDIWSTIAAGLGGAALGYTGATVQQWLQAGMPGGLTGLANSVTKGVTSVAAAAAAPSSTTPVTLTPLPGNDVISVPDIVATPQNDIDLDPGFLGYQGGMTAVNAAVKQANAGQAPSGSTNIGSVAQSILDQLEGGMFS